MKKDRWEAATLEASSRMRVAKGATSPSLAIPEPLKIRALVLGEAGAPQHAGIFPAPRKTLSRSLRWGARNIMTDAAIEEKLASGGVLQGHCAPGYEAVATCLASPEVRARTDGVIAWRPQRSASAPLSGR